MAHIRQAETLSIAQPEYLCERQVITIVKELSILSVQRPQGGMRLRDHRQNLLLITQGDFLFVKCLSQRNRQRLIRWQ